jgi:hypothetical protein
MNQNPTNSFVGVCQSQNDLKILGRICRLMKVNGVNVAGVKAILHMEAVMAKGREGEEQ